LHTLLGYDTLSLTVVCFSQYIIHNTGKRNIVYTCSPLRRGW